MQSDQVLSELWRIGRELTPPLMDGLTPLERDGSAASVQQSRRALLGVLSSATDAVRVLARTSSHCPEAIVRNGLATSRGAHLGLWLALIESDALEGLVPGDSRLTGELLPKEWRVKGREAFDALLNEERNATPEEWARAHFREPVRAILAGAISAAATGKPLPRQHFVKLVARLSKKELEALSSGLDQVEKQLPPMKLSRLEVGALGENVFNFAIESDRTRRWILSGAARKAYTANPERFRARTPAVHAAADLLIRQVRERDFGNHSKPSAPSTAAMRLVAQLPRWSTRLSGAIQTPAVDAVYTPGVHWPGEIEDGLFEVLAKELSTEDRSLLHFLLQRKNQPGDVVSPLNRRDQVGMLCSLAEHGQVEAATSMLALIPSARIDAIVLKAFRRSPSAVGSLVLQFPAESLAFAALARRLRRSPKLAEQAFGSDPVKAVTHIDSGERLVALVGQRFIARRLNPATLRKPLLRGPVRERARVKSLLAAVMVDGDLHECAQVVQASLMVDPDGELLASLVASSRQRGLLPGECLAAILAVDERWKNGVKSTRQLERLGLKMARAVPAEDWAQVQVSRARAPRLRGILRMAPKSRLPRLITAQSPDMAEKLLGRREYHRELVHLSLVSSTAGWRLHQEASAIERHRLRKWIVSEWANAPGVRTALELASLVGFSDARHLTGLARSLAQETDRKPGSGLDDLYHTHLLPKRSGGTRTITAPEKRLRRLQRRILRRVLEPLEVHDAAHGFRRGRSIVTNAEPHVGQVMVVNLDIKSFFPSTSHELVVHALRRALGTKLSEGALRLLADICSYDGGLPIGAPTSPAIANLVLLPADQALTKAAAKFNLKYTRYADDLTFSGHGDTHRVIPFVEKVLGSAGYELEPRKVNIFRRGRRQVVTGLVVNEKVNVPRAVRRKLRAAVHRYANGGPALWHCREMSESELLGRIAALGAVRPHEAREMREAVRRVKNE